MQKSGAFLLGATAAPASLPPSKRKQLLRLAGALPIVEAERKVIWARRLFWARSVLIGNISLSKYPSEHGGNLPPFRESARSRRIKNLSGSDRKLVRLTILILFTYPAISTKPLFRASIEL